MSAKNTDRHDRWRSITVGFRVSPEESRQINEMVALSGLSKQEYCFRCCMQRKITVTPNPRVYKALKSTIEQLSTELQRFCTVSELSDETIDTLDVVVGMLCQLKGAQDDD